MTYRIEFTPDRMHVRADVSTRAELAALIRAIEKVAQFWGEPETASRSEEITREPRQAKALRAAKAEKEIRPEPLSAGRVDAVAASPGRVEKPAADRHAVHRGFKPSVPADRDEKLKKLWAEGVSTQRIADELGMGTSSNVSFRAKWLGLPPRARGGDRRSKPADTFDPSYYARHAIIPDRDEPPLAADITAALMGDPGHGPSLTVERAGPQQRGGEPT